MEMLKFSGYETFESVMKLKKPGEIEKIIDFVKENIDVIDDKSKILGIFEKNPSKLKLLPGVEPILQKFISSVEMAKYPKKRHVPSLPSQKKVQSSHKTKNVSIENSIPPVETLDSEDKNTNENIVDRITKWIKDQNGYEEAM